ncbi:MAG: zf-HC2 domain-containing protein [Candidatus Aminicenantes bacterium]|nr:zf-HC2 domain-containing protein [Candidatus Aminicenantes bacterium]
MSCKKNKRKISDLLDGRFSNKQKSVLENHISRCPSCQEYKNQLIALRSKVRESDKKEMSKDYAQEFSIRLKNRLLNEQQKKKQKNRFQGFEKWAYTVAGFTIVLFLLVYSVIFQPISVQTEEYFVLSYEEAIGDISRELSREPDLMDVFNSILTASLNEAFEELGEDKISLILENFIYEEKPGIEGTKILESKTKRNENIKS